MILITDINVDDNVLPMKSFASIGDWSSGTHLHFGIYPESYIPASPWGRMPCSNWPNTYGFVDPIGWIKNQEPISGALAIVDSQNPIYWLQIWKAYHVLDEQLIQNMSSLPGWGMDDIYEYPADVLKISPLGHSAPEGAFEQGPDFIGIGSTSNGLLIKQIDNPNVYLVENDQRKWIISAQVFEELGYDWNDVITVSEAIINQIPEGAPIYSGYGNWIKGYTNRHDLEGKAFIRTSDGGFLIVGSISTETEEGAFVLKVDEFGAIEDLKKRYADLNSYRFYSALEISENDYLIAGSHIYMNVGNQGLIIKIDSQGNKLWEKEYPGIAAIQDIKKTADGSYVIFGYRNNCMPLPDCGGYGHVLMKLNADLRPDWRYAIDGMAGYIKADPIIEMSGGGYIFSAGNKIVTVLANGEPGWQRRYDIEDPLITINSLDSIYPLLDGQFLVAGKVINNHNDLKILVFKINRDGECSWAKSFNYNDGQRSQVLVNTVIELSNQDILVLAENEYTGAPRQISLLRLFPNGSFKWNKEFGYLDERWTKPIQLLADEMNHIYLLGSMRYDPDWPFGDDTLLLKLGQSGIVNSECDFVTDTQLAEGNLDLVDIETSATIDLTKYDSVDFDEIQTFQTGIRMYPICQGSSLNDQTISQLPFGLVPDFTIFDAINFLSSIIHRKLYIGKRALYKVVLNWPDSDLFLIPSATDLILNSPGGEMRLEVFNPDGTLYGEYQNTTPPISVDIPNPEEGLWTYKVTALDIPYDEYPFSLVAGITKYPDYIGFWGGLRYLPKEAEMQRLCNQLS